MSEAQSYAQAFDAYNNEFVKQQGLEFLSFLSPSDVVAPHPDLFESDIDSNLAAFPDQLQLLTVDSNDAFSFFRSEKPQWQGPLSTITVSSYDSLSSHSESFYNEPIQSFAPTVANSQLFDFDLDMDFNRVRVGGSEYSAASLNIMEDDNDPTSFGALPPTPPRSPPVSMNTSKAFDKSYPPRTSFSDYGPPRRGSTTSSDYYSHSGYSPSHGHPTVSPLHISTQLPTMATVTPQPVDEYKGDPRKKYRCPSCPRAFARAYNLKTHMATHDPNRLKPHVCPQRSCGRSFSRKHDLGRHLISIHRDESVSASLLPAGSKKAIGVESGTRSWCESCGKSWVGRSAECDCADIK
ncbi:hypothetical protein JR316_0001153 [Psilocybe cubensis]|uniref:C2H2-type domain-containing protein n=2 Tax=Psilocybe cubensis TaxID=181762 RepID=A0A8H7YAT3_PSICU|nr:hypothetical protein JR316_0001153 [Psilocybe cubensis]KAH9487085.1 hypothetical protein JR316_0001153 [Psilocybe cubensis]